MSAVVDSKTNNGLSLTDNQLFWVLQVTVWLMLGPIWYSVYTVTFGQTDLAYLVHPMLQSVLGIFVSWPMRYVFRATWDMHAAAKLPIIALTVLFFSLLWTMFRLVTFIWISGESKNFLPEIGLWYFPSVLIFACWAALYHGFRYYRFLQMEHAFLLQSESEKQAERLRRKNAEHLAREAQFKMLRYQLNPHFLFNTMNAITSLVNAGRNAEASSMIDALSAFLRDSLEGDPFRPVTLRKELESLETYLSIEKTRFGDRLELQISAPEQVLNFRVPGLLLQPLAENVIKHAVRPTSQTVTMTIAARMDDADLLIEVADTGPGIVGLENGQVPSGGIGLENVRARLENMYGDRQRFQIESNAGAGLKIGIRIPAMSEVGAAFPGEAADA